MKRSKKHRVKQELPETSTSRPASHKEHDLAYYIHDRVELMHQVFSVLKSKEIKAMAPECVRHISVSDLQELCMEELLGISSKRLCAILDGATPPSDTESSSESEQLETISLDSISSDEEILSQVSSRKPKKHKHRSKSKPKKRKSKDNDGEDKDQADRSRRAGLTVLELLELQARARAIRAQLQQEQASAVSTGRPSESVTGNSSDDEVEIKEEAAEVVEISSEDEKPNVQELEEKITAAQKDTMQDTSSNSKTVTKKVNDLIITVPKTNTSRKIKLKRNTGRNSKSDDKPPINESYAKTSSSIVLDEETAKTKARKHGSESSNHLTSTNTIDTIVTQNSQSKFDKSSIVAAKDKNKSKDKKKKRKKNKDNDKDGSDHDEITLQLSDTEKMDLLEDLDGKKPEKCSGTEDSSSDSSDEDSVKDNSDEDRYLKPNDADTYNTNVDKDKVIKEISIETGSRIEDEPIMNQKNLFVDSTTKEVNDLHENKTSFNTIDEGDVQVIEKVKATSSEKDGETIVCEIDDVQLIDSTVKENVVSDKNTIEIDSSHDTSPLTSDFDNTLNVKQSIQVAEMKQDLKFTEIQSSEVSQEKNDKTASEEIDDAQNASNLQVNTVAKICNNEADDATKDNLKEKSDGELSDRDSSEVEASDIKPDVVCISDDEEKKGKKKKKKDKKNKKEKKAKKKKDFRESADQNFYSEKSKNSLEQPNPLENEVVLISEDIENDDSTSICDSIVVENTYKFRQNEVITISESDKNKSKDEFKEMEHFKLEVMNTDTDLDDGVYEILELSDDSSCYEVEEISISKEPTAEEIEALSAKVDELERDRAIENTKTDKEFEESDTLSWKQRYLKSTKVKKVLTTANIMNAMRKKNLELKKKLQESKKDIIENKPENVEVAPSNFEDGSIEQYNTLEASTKYIDPVKETNGNTDNAENIENVSQDKIAEENNGTDRIGPNSKEKDTVTNAMKKEAKQLLKMYKMLLKYNDMTKTKDPSKKKKKKKKNKEKDKCVASQVVTTD